MAPPSTLMYGGGGRVRTVVGGVGVEGVGGTGVGMEEVEFEVEF